MLTARPGSSHGYSIDDELPTWTSWAFDLDRTTRAPERRPRATAKRTAEQEETQVLQLRRSVTARQPQELDPGLPVAFG